MDIRFRPVCYICCRLSIPAWLYLLCPPSLPSPIFVVFDHCCWLLYCCWLPLRALLSSLLLSCFAQCYCEALRAQTRWGALEVFFIIIIIIITLTTATLWRSGADPHLKTLPATHTQNGFDSVSSNSEESILCRS